jgi:putative nucleotidyltransferase with HDIG domain
MSGQTTAAHAFYPESDGPLHRKAQSIRALIVDDDVTISALFSESLSSAEFDVYSAASGQETLDLIERAVFDIVLLDVFLPDCDGFELLRKIKAVHPELAVIMITGQGDAEMARKALVAGASDFVTKPCRVSELPIIVERNLARSALGARSNRTFQRALEVSYEAVLDALLAALDTRDTETEGHSERVTAYTMILAEQLGVPQEELYHIERGALLHDIGKIGVPDRILLKPGPLTEDEWIEMRKHPVVGFKMCANIEFLKGAAQIVLHHHERWDGNGYPDGIEGEMIPLGARIFSVVDTFDAMTTDRPYRKALSYEDARSEIERNRGTQFDPAVVDAFLSIPEDRWCAIRETSRK